MSGVSFSEIEKGVSYTFRCAFDHNLPAFIGSILSTYSFPQICYEQIIFTKWKGGKTFISSPFSFYELYRIEPLEDDKAKKSLLIQNLNASPPGCFGELKLENAPGGVFYFQGRRNYLELVRSNSARKLMQGGSQS